MSSLSSSTSKRPSSAKTPSGQQEFHRSASSKSLSKHHGATTFPSEPSISSSATSINSPLQSAANMTPTNTTTIAGMTFTEGFHQHLTLEELRRRVEAVQMGKSKAADLTPAKERDIFSQAREKENIASRRLAAERAMSQQTIDSMTSTVNSVSTDSAKTVRGDDLKSPEHIMTPSYPFPRIPLRLSRGPSQMSTFSHKPFTLLSPTNAPADGGDETPSAGMAGSEFSAHTQTGRIGPSRNPSSSEDPNFPSPNLYDMILMLSSEPGMEAWWSNVVQILQDYYGVERASLAVPGDITDLENVPWGQKATFDVMGMANTEPSFPNSSIATSEPSANPKESINNSLPSRKSEASLSAVKEESQHLTPVRPSLENRHSFAGHQIPERPKPPTRAVSNFSHTDARSFHSAQSHRDVEDNSCRVPDQPSKESQVVAVADTLSQTPLAAVYRIPQPLESEADPLLVRTGVTKLFGKTRPIVLTREYADDGQPSVSISNAQEKDNETDDPHKQGKESNEPSKGTKRKPLVPGLDESSSGYRRLLAAAVPRQAYEDYEQPEPSPWSQSPAPSPAARPDPAESPFFVKSGTVDEEAFQPNPPNYDYSQRGPVEAIGTDTSKTLIHIPLVQHVSSRGKMTSTLRFPMAVLSLLTPINPYPSNLRRSLTYLLPHLAATYSLAVQYSTLEARVTGVSTGLYGPGYGLGGTFSDESSELELVAELSGQIAQGAISAHGSMHSPSGSAASRESPASSVAGTPGMDPTVYGLSPGIAMTPGRFGPEMVDSYFTAKRNRGVGASQSSAQAARSADRSAQSRSSMDESPASARSKKTRAAQNSQSSSRSSKQPTQRAAVEEKNELEETERRSVSSADLPEQVRHMSTSSMMTTTKGGRDIASRPLPDLISQLMLNSVPLQLFLAKPQTGELLWTNTRFQAFRSQTLGQRVKDPWQNVHPTDREALEPGWRHVLKSGTQFTMHIRVKRFNSDSDYRWFIFRASTLLSQTGQILYFIGSFMDVHEQHLAELKAAEEKEIAARDAKYRALANSIPQILFEAIEDQGIVSANDQWYVFSGQSMEEALNLGFARNVHRDDLIKCGIILPTLSTELDPSKQELKLTFTEPQDQDVATDISASSNSSNKTVQATTPDVSTPQRTKPPTLSTLVKEGIISVQEDENGRPSYSIEIRLKSKGGEYRWFLVRLVKVYSPLLNGGRATWYGTCTDINDRKNLERELHTAMTKLNVEMESKTRFFANMSHEIRTPLNGILGSIPWLLESVLDVDQRRTLDTIQNSSNNLRELVDNILDVTKVEAGKMTLVHRWFHVRTLLEDTIDTISSRAIDRGLELNYTVDLEVPHTVKGDALRLRQVLINLIGNAVKFTEHGEVYAHCSVKRDPGLDPNQVMLAFQVVDTGKGFNEQDLQRLFKQFGQIESSNSHHEAGTGLGLFLSKQLVEMHGGRMEATGQEGQGATFTFTVKVGLPTAEDQPASPSQPRAKRKPSGITETMPSSPGGAISALATKEVPPSPSLSRPSFSPGLGSPGPLSSTSSAPSLHSTQYTTDRSTPSPLIPTPESTSNLQTSKLTAAMAPSERLKLAELAMAAKPAIESLSGQKLTHSAHPTTFSIVVICPAKYARNAFKQHIEQVVPHEIAANVTTMGGIDEWLELSKGSTPPVFTHVVVDLPESHNINYFMQQIASMKTALVPELVIITDHYQKREIMEQQKSMLDLGLKVYLVTKPVKPSVFALIFDPAQLRNLSKDRGRDIAQAKTEDFKKVAQRVRETIGSRGFRILVVEDSDVNRQVILKYLQRVKLESDTATNGLECTQMVLAKGLDYYSLIICDIQMPLKNGYEVCQELRKWERESNRAPMPIMALSANAMPEEKAAAAQSGFTDYLTKPVDFNILGQMMVTLLDPTIPHVFLRDRPDRLGL